MKTYLRGSRFAAALFASVLVLAACGGDDNDTSDDNNAAQEAPEPSDEPVHLTISHNAVRPDVVAVWIEDYVIPEFEAKMADEGREVTVEHIEGGVDDYKTQLALDLSVGEGPDITSFDQFWTAEFAAGGLIEPLHTVVGDVVNDWEGWEQIPEAVSGSLDVDGERYGIPLGTDGRVLFFRTDLFEEAGLPTDWQPTSWDEILDAARTIQSELPDVIPMQLNAGVNMEEATTLQGFIPILLGAGGDLYADDGWQGDTPELRETLEFYSTVFDEGLADSDMQLVTDGRDRSFEAFADGNLAIMIESDYLWRGVINPDGGFPIENREDLVGWALIPAKQPGAGINGQDFVSASGGTGRIINPNTEHPLEAWELLSFMATYEAQLDWVEREPRITAREDVNEIGIADDPMQTFVAEEVLPLTWYRPGFEEYPQVSEAIQRMVENVIAGRSDVDSAAQEFHSNLEGIVGAENVSGG
ncbi:extracellular solute-binding protein [Phytoactinopolyspora mesophila]|uniref:Extracellular solute-binding protein n=1 Tax=Phytoactinopolyspora mesophila TaxID=2650750 RepID=A0A7K3M0X0_9ACTN|nr:extracellular solute-binding protein [Phytoactinopolyspora mesophila]NDL56943.1 extracellular solute-binding protein [Phytoactinopolyspora mesophila]